MKIQEATKAKFQLKRIEPMSSDGFNRLRASSKLYLKKEVYKVLGKLEIDYNIVYDERTLAFCILKAYGAGIYTGHFWNTENHKLAKEAFRVEIMGDIDSRWSYDFVHTRGIARRKWWIPNY